MRHRKTCVDVCHVRAGDEEEEEGYSFGVRGQTRTPFPKR